MVHRYLATANFLRTIVNHSILWRPGAILVAASAVLLPILFAFDSPKISIAASAIVAVVWGWCLYFPSDEAMPDFYTRSNELLERSQQIVLHSTPEIQRLDYGARTASTKLEKLKIQKWQESEEFRSQQELQERQQRLRDLLSLDWKALRSEPFEQFLELVFRELGYVVQTTRVTGDQGVDLIVEQNGWKCAIQVKGYFNSVSNSAVQEAHAGKSYYGCAACAVITNSRFTASAKDLADRIGCALIDEDLIPALVLGGVDLHQRCNAIQTAQQPGYSLPPTPRNQ